MVTILKRDASSYYTVRNSQLRYAIIYVIITAVALCFLNISAASISRNLVFIANESAVMERARMIAASFPELDSVTNEAAQQAVLVLGQKSYDRIVITDADGVSIYDSLTTGNETGAQFLLSSVVEALDGQDVFYSRFHDGAVECYACVPIMYYDMPIGAVYLTLCDSAQGALLQGLEATVLRLSVVLELLIIAFSIAFSAVYARRMHRIMDSIRFVREGDYSYKIKMHTNDEMERLASEFNDLTDRLQESEQRRRQFVSDASHELKTPLASIKLLSDSILQNDMEEAMVREFVGDIGAEADRLTRMSQNLLELTKLDSMVEEQRAAVDIQPVARKVFRMLQPQMGKKNIRMEDASIPGCTILIGEDDLYQIIFNLVENGIKYNVEGGLLRFSLEKDHSNVTMKFEDSGVGIPEASIGQIFERFYRVDKARSRMAGGSGLGLSIVHDKVVRNAGAVQAENRPEGGACFTVVFPYFGGEVETE